MVEAGIELQTLRGSAPRVVAAEHHDEVHWLGRTLNAFLAAARQR